MELGDKRLNSRLVMQAQPLAASPIASIPAACGGWGDTAAAYRLLDNKRCDWREIIEAHGRCAVQRMAGLPVVLCLQNTTKLDFNGQTIQGSRVRQLRPQVLDFIDLKFQTCPYNRLSCWD